MSTENEKREIVRNLPNHELVTGLHSLASDFCAGLAFLYSPEGNLAAAITLEEVANRLESPVISHIEHDTTVTTGDREDSEG